MARIMVTTITLIVEEHTSNQRNFSQQVEMCKEKGASLFYARSLEEMNFVWDFVYMPQRSDDDPETTLVSGDWFLHMGFERLQNYQRGHPSR